MRRAVAGVVAFAAVLALRASMTGNTPIPLVTFGQGVTLVNIEGVPVFVSRQGEVLTGFAARDPDGGGELYWCPREQAFVNPKTTSLYDESGRYVAGPSPYDMRQIGLRRDDVALTVTVDVRPLARRARSTNGTVSGEAGDAWQRFAHGDKFAAFCKDPLKP
jgi:hypothetical protein